METCRLFPTVSQRLKITLQHVFLAISKDNGGKKKNKNSHAKKKCTPGIRGLDLWSAGPLASSSAVRLTKPGRNFYNTAKPRMMIKWALNNLVSLLCFLFLFLF